LQDFYQRHRTKFIPVDPKQDAFFKDQQQTDPDAFFREAIESLCRAAQTHGVKPILLYLPLLTELESGIPGNILKAKNEVSEKLHVPLIDLTGDLKANRKALYLEADPVHLNAPGNEIVGRRLFEVLSPMITP
jgi:lysophospholipase L1-like esterase